MNVLEERIKDRVTGKKEMKEERVIEKKERKKKE